MSTPPVPQSGAGGWTLRDSIPVGPIPGSDEFAAGFARMIATQWGLQPLADAAALVARELIRHAIRSLAGMPPLTVALSLTSDGARLIVAAWDANPGTPLPGPDGQPAWGLDAAAAVAARGGFRAESLGEPPRPGKTVWFLLEERGTAR